MCTAHNLAVGRLSSKFHFDSHVGVLTNVHGLDSASKDFKWSLKDKTLLFSGMGDNKPVYGDVR